MRTLSGTERVSVVGQTNVTGRESVTVELAYRDAVPLFTWLQAGGSWRPFYPFDRVWVSLERETWFPLTYQVLPAAGEEREQWAARNGLPPEPPGRAVFSAVARSFGEAAPPLAPLRSPPGARDQGFRDAAIARLTRSAAVLPSDLQGLRPYRAGTFVSGTRARDEVLLSFARGLSWLKVRETRSWSRPELFGDVGPLAAPVRVGAGVAYYEPATAALGRRLSIHARGRDLYLESNLARESLLRVAASIPVRGLPAPPEWLVRAIPGGVVREQVPLELARQEAPWLLLPASLPPGYRLWTVRLVEAGAGVAVTVFFRRPGAELDGGGIRLHQAFGSGLPPPMDPDVLAVRTRGVTGRYAPGRGELEWVEGGVYRSLGGGALDLAGLLRVAASLEGPG